MKTSFPDGCCFKEGFYNDLSREKDLRLIKAVKSIILSVEQVGNITDLQNLKKLKSSPVAYRIRKGNYRVGIYIEGDTVTFAAFDHRKDFYKSFPKSK